MKYADKLKDPRWQKKRLKILERDNFTCQLCNDKETELQIHHLKYTGEPWEAPNKDLQTLCRDCHEVTPLLKKNDLAGLSILKIKKNGLSLYTIKLKDGIMLFYFSPETHSQFIAITDGMFNTVIDFFKTTK